MPPSAARASPASIVTEDGLRYRSKPAGTPFGAGSRYAGTVMSCFLCGHHRPRSLLKARRLVGRTQYVCEPACGGGLR